MNDEAESNDPRSGMQSIFNTTRCYDIMQESNKVIVFETYISFQLAFFALIEHETEVAPLWDPEKRCLVGLMCIADYIQALQVLRQHNMLVVELASKSIHEVMSSSMVTSLYSYIAHASTGNDTPSIDAEDSVFQLVMLLDRLGTDYIAVVNPDEGNIVSVLGYTDILNLLYIATKQHPQLFVQTVQTIFNEQNAITAAQGNTHIVMTVPKSAKVTDVIRAMYDRNLTAVPVVDDITNKVIGIYHKSDVTFVVRAADSDAVLTNLANMTVGDVLLSSQQQFQQAVAPELITRVFNLVKIRPQDKLMNVIESMAMARITIAVCVNEADLCIGIVTIKDILRHFFPIATVS